MIVPYAHEPEHVALLTVQEDLQTVRVEAAPGVSMPMGVRYGWLDGQPINGCNLYSSAQLPTIPFTATIP